MKNNETGEFELVLGNRQLLSGFFIVVILFAVFFTMGYIVGRNSGPSTRAALTTPEPQATAAAPAMQAETPRAAVEPGQTPPAPQKTMAEASKPAETEPEAKREAEPAGRESGLSEPAPGTYWQVSAVKRSVADAVLKALKERSFPATLAPGPNDLVRVLVGPYNDATALGTAKTELERAGFHPIMRK